MSCFIYEAETSPYSFARVFLTDKQWCQIDMFLSNKEFANLVELIRCGFVFFTFALATNIEEQMSHPNDKLASLSSVKKIDATISSPFIESFVFHLEEVQSAGSVNSLFFRPRLTSYSFGKPEPHLTPPD